MEEEKKIKFPTAGVFTSQNPYKGIGSDEKAGFGGGCRGKRDESCPLDEELIRKRVVSDASATSYNRRRRQAEGQLALF